MEHDDALGMAREMVDMEEAQVRRKAYELKEAWAQVDVMTNEQLNAPLYDPEADPRAKVVRDIFNNLLQSKARMRELDAKVRYREIKLEEVNKKLDQLRKEVKRIEGPSVPHELRRLKRSKLHRFDEKQVYIYFLCWKGCVVYVGQTRHLANRMQQHRKDKEFDAVYYVLADNRQRLETLENTFIALLQPSMNKSGFMQHIPGGPEKSLARYLEDD